MKLTKHFLSLKGFPLKDARLILDFAKKYKASRKNPFARPLEGQTWALLFSKSSTRTRVSFEVGIREMGGDCFFLNSQDIQLGRGEPIKDTARVLGRMTHGAVIRTFAHSDVVDFAHFSNIPTINALTDDEHPCQILADILTFEERNGSIQGKKVVFLGDGACNVARSWAYAAEQFQFNLVIAAPQGYECAVKNAFVTQTSLAPEAAHSADLLYTDTWISMGKETEGAQRLAELAPYQLNHDLLSLAKKDALVLHCLPAYRGKEITEALLEERAEEIFDQSENRLHAQKGIIHWLVS